MFNRDGSSVEAKQQFVAKAIGIPFENWHHQCHGIILPL
jgi:hypothetical protein